MSEPAWVSVMKTIRREFGEPLTQREARVELDRLRAIEARIRKGIKHLEGRKGIAAARVRKLLVDLLGEPK